MRTDLQTESKSAPRIPLPGVFNSMNSTSVCRLMAATSTRVLRSLYEASSWIVFNSVAAESLWTSLPVSTSAALILMFAE